MGKKACHKIKGSSAGVGSSSLPKGISSSFYPIVSGFIPPSSDLGLSLLSFGLARHFTHSMSIPFAEPVSQPMSPPDLLSLPSKTSCPKSSSKCKTVPSESPNLLALKKVKSIELGSSSNPSLSKTPPLVPPFYSNDKLLRLKDNILSVTHLQQPNDNLAGEFYANLDGSILNKNILKSSKVAQSVPSNERVCSSSKDDGVSSKLPLESSQPHVNSSEHDSMLGVDPHTQEESLIADVQGMIHSVDDTSSLCPSTSDPMTSSLIP
uniref:Uncharacterized protein n=1 Tax=Cannabis sativa TaxID=3483 RepID=A0A803NUB8_CANSA